MKRRETFTVFPPSLEANPEISKPHPIIDLSPKKMSKLKRQSSCLSPTPKMLKSKGKNEDLSFKKSSFAKKKAQLKRSSINSNQVANILDAKKAEDETESKKETPIIRVRRVRPKSVQGKASITTQTSFYSKLDNVTKKINEYVRMFGTKLNIRNIKRIKGRFKWYRKTFMDEVCKLDSLPEIQSILQKVESKKIKRQKIEKVISDEKDEIHIRQLQDALKKRDSCSVSYSSEYEDEIDYKVFPSHYTIDRSNPRIRASITKILHNYLTNSFVPNNQNLKEEAENSSDNSYSFNEEDNEKNKDTLKSIKIKTQMKKKMSQQFILKFNKLKNKPKDE